jgi:hypothetical protein
VLNGGKQGETKIKPYLIAPKQKLKLMGRDIFEFQEA